MRKQLLLMLILCLSATMVWAERIDVSTARKVAENVANAGSGLRSAGDLSLVYAAAPGKSGSALRSGTVDGAADYFVFNVSGNKGFVIVSGEDRALPVFGYSDEGAFDPDNLPDNLRYMLAYYQNQITWLERSGIEVTADIQAEWSHYLNGTNFRSTAQEVVLETAEWDQGKPYNGMTPLISGEHALTGCVATAQAIIMRYHQYPVRAIGGVSSYDGVSTTYDDYDWANMPLTYPRDGYGDARDNAVAKLMWHCGANVEMSYGLSASGASMKLPAKSYVEVFGYSSAIRYLKKETYRWEEWKEMIRKELDAGYPLSYGGQSSGGGHAFVCDGYDAQGFFHINWGWGGYSNGFFALSVLDSNYGNDGYSDSQEMILNIRPSQTGDKKYVYKPVVTDISYSGSLPLTGNVGMSIGLRYTAFDNLDYYVGLAVVDVSGRIIQQPSDPKSMNFEAYVPGWRNYSTYRNITLSTSLGEGQRIAVVGSSDGRDWEVMRCLTTSPTGLDNNGLIDAPADSPDEPAVNPVSVSIYWNQFDDVFMAVSGLDNNQYNGQNTQGISYKLTNVTENVILRYTLKNYAAWKGQLDVYYGDNNSIYQPSQGTKAVIGEDGSFSVPVSLAQISEGAYVN
ncbi:C10 family peptidase, partial [Parabacteroides distasonis]|uniref:C10 family peptidase n=2 Tax=Tannerellaceae TaxID=2005525 RepID=UPI00325B7A0A